MWMRLSLTFCGNVKCIRVPGSRMNGNKTLSPYFHVWSMRCLSVPVRCGEAEVGQTFAKKWLEIRLQSLDACPIRHGNEMSLHCAKRHFMQDAFKGQVSVSCAPSISNLKTVQGSWQRSAPTFGMARSLVSGIPGFSVCSGLYSKAIVNTGWDKADKTDKIDNTGTMSHTTLRKASMTTVIVAGCCVAEAGPMFGLLFCVWEALQTEFQTCAGLCVWVNGLMDYALQLQLPLFTESLRLPALRTRQYIYIYIYIYTYIYINAWL